MPILLLTNLRSELPWLRIAVPQAGYTADLRLFRNTEDGPAGIRAYYLWSDEGEFADQERSDLPPGAYELKTYCTPGDWANNRNARPAGVSVRIPQGTTVRQTIPYNSSWSCRPAGSRAVETTIESQTLEFMAVSTGSTLAVELTITDPDGRTLSPARNDFGDLGRYWIADVNGDGVNDAGATIQTERSGLYTIAWKGASGTVASSGFRLQLWQGNSFTEILPQTFLYQRSAGSIDYSVVLSAPSAVQDLTATQASTEKEIDLTWSDAAGTSGPLSIDLRYGAASMTGEDGFASSPQLPVPDSAVPGPHRLRLRLPEANTTYFFRMRTSGKAGTSGLSNEASAKSGPGGSDYSPDVTPPTVPVVMVQGEATLGALAFQWSSTDPESGIVNYTIALGTAPNGTDVIPWRDVGTSTSRTFASQSITGGRAYFLSVIARNGARLESSPGSSDGVLVKDACTDDKFEPDDDTSRAVEIPVNRSQTHNLCSGPDFLKFVTKAGNAYEVKTSGLGGLARVKLTLLDLSTGVMLGQSADGKELRWFAPADGVAGLMITSADGLYGDHREYSVTVGENSAVLLSKGQVAIDVSWRSQYSGASGGATALPQGDGFAFFYFSDPNNPEVFVKVLDFGPNSPYLLFYAGLTDFEYTVTFTNLTTRQTVSYFKPAGSFSGGATNNDLPHASFKTILWSRDGGSAEEVTPETAGRLDLPRTPELEAIRGRKAAGLPSPNASTEMVLSRGGVAVTVKWRSQYSGQSGNAFALPQKDEFGFFYFTDPNNPEVFVKVLDFGQSSPYLVFYAGLTDFEYEVTFRNVYSNQSVTFKKPAGSFMGGADNKTLGHAPCTALTASPSVSITGATQTSVNTSWGTLSNAAGYKLYRSGTLIYSGTATSYADVGLTAGTRYCYIVRGYNPCGDGPSSGEACASTQAPVCSSFLASPAAVAAPADGGSASLTVTGVPAGCSGGGWSATSNTTWLSVLPGSGSGSGSATVSYQANPTTSQRQGSVTIAGSTVTVTQAGAATPTCTSFTVSPSSISAGPGAGNTAVSITGSPSGCTGGAWSASTSENWISVGPGSGTGSGAVTVYYLANPSSTPRQGGLTIAGTSVTVTQAGASPTCTSFTVAPASVQVPATAGSTSVTVTGSPAGCSGGSWLATSGSNWLTVSPSSGSGSGSVTLSYTANTSTSRQGSATIAGKPVSVTQSGSGGGSGGGPGGG
ncbi:MAG: BACON domain-containing protein [Acidobacteria bacterium]|nr:BACON domain-containing protein [Acidobacteriota bacterium]